MRDMQKLDVPQPFTAHARRRAAAATALVLHVRYLLFNEGDAASGGNEVARVELADEAIR